MLLLQGSLFGHFYAEHKVWIITLFDPSCHNMLADASSLLPRLFLINTLNGLNVEWVCIP